MKLKKILLLVGITCGGFLSCTSESIIDEPVIESQELSIILTTSNNLSTKATVGEAPSSDEKNIDDCHVAIFDADGKRIYSKNFSEMGDAGTDSKYTLNLGLVRTFGKGVKNITVYILANAGSYSLFDNCENYSAYQEKGIVLTEKFQADRLLKAGLVSETFEYDPDDLTGNVKEITVPLTQLSARVDFLGVEVEGQGAQVGGYSLSSSFVGINKKTSVTIYNNEIKENTVEDLSTNSLELKESRSFYTYEGGQIKILLDVDFASSHNGYGATKKSYTLDLSSKRFVKGNIYQIKGKINPALPSEIVWEVIPIPWKEIPVNIPGFN